jgi:microcompartment protein CcmK/EutM
MQLARVTGTVVATVKVPGLTGIKLLLVQPLDRQLRPVGGQVVAADAVHMAGPGELVYIVAAREAAAAMPDPFVPVDHAIVGIVDAVRSLAGDDPAAQPSAAGSSAAGSSAAEGPASAEPRAAKASSAGKRRAGGARP